MQVHVCDAGGRWGRAHLLFRGFLRADAAAREAYAALKQDLAARLRNDRVACNEAKTVFILDTLAAAEARPAAAHWSP